MLVFLEDKRLFLSFSRISSNTMHRGVDKNRGRGKGRGGRGGRRPNNVAVEVLTEEQKMELEAKHPFLHLDADFGEGEAQCNRYSLVEQEAVKYFVTQLPFLPCSTYPFILRI